MKHGSQTPIHARHQGTIFIAALVMCGVFLFAAVACLSLCVPLATEDESSLIE